MGIDAPFLMMRGPSHAIHYVSLNLNSASGQTLFLGGTSVF
jgi:hypothetical protein